MADPAARVTARDFFTGLFAALAFRGSGSISIRNDRLDRALAPVFEQFLRRAEAEDIEVDFRIRLHPIHRDSIIVRNAIYSAAQRDLISLDNPEYQDVRFKLTKEEADRVLSTLPGGKDLFLSVADSLVDSYEALPG
ncbi:MAG: hypothetical protein HYY01_02075 [Chloroflexi bacterium]|nr:hypothetical protein [Chloroflexota bacterium]